MGKSFLPNNGSIEIWEQTNKPNQERRKGEEGQTKGHNNENNTKNFYRKIPSHPNQQELLPLF